jgi:flavodoxin
MEEQYNGQTILILYDTCHGATRRIANLLQQFLSELLLLKPTIVVVVAENANNYVDNKDLPDNIQLLILGSGVHNMTWFDGAQNVFQ